MGASDACHPSAASSSRGGTGHEHAPDERVYNYALPAGSGDDTLKNSLEQISLLAESWRPQVVLIAIGADGLETDPTVVTKLVPYVEERLRRRSSTTWRCTLT